ncbi:MAG: SOUL heme-binding protein [Gammaproteobacteria bacterium]|nr:SOUL heme-binding protein [Gammaproteobacteria bacterium]
MKKNLIFLLKINIFLIIFFIYTKAMAYEEPSFKIVHQTDVYEIRQYGNRLAVQANYTNQNSSFRNLFNYISGANADSEKIKMTIPVTQFEENSEMVMQFYLPSKFTKKTAPFPTDPKVKVIIIDEGYYAVIKYSGRLTDKNFNKHKKILREKLIQDKMEIIGPAINAIYNGPFTLPILRRNETMFRVNW